MEPSPGTAHMVAAAAANLGAAASLIYERINQCSDAGQLDAASRMLWQCHADGSITDEEASYLSSCIEHRRPRSRDRAPSQATPLAKLTARIGSRFVSRQRQRSPDRKASRDRRRMLGGSSALPDDLRHYYTEGQRAVLCILVAWRDSGRRIGSAYGSSSATPTQGRSKAHDARVSCPSPFRGPNARGQFRPRAASSNT
jgi:hypothetical protein